MSSSWNNIVSRPRAYLVASTLLFPFIAAAQNAISVQAGMIHHIEGNVLLDEEPLKLNPAQFLHLEKGERLRTEDGRAEMVLAIGSFLRLAKDSEIEMLDAGVTSASVRLLAGSAVIDAEEVFDEDSISLVVGEARVRLPKRGLYRFDLLPGESPSVKVFQGKALVAANGSEHQVKSKKAIRLSDASGEMSINKFDRSQKDPLDQWNRERASEIAKTRRPKRAGNDPMDVLWKGGSARWGCSAGLPTCRTGPSPPSRRPSPPPPRQPPPSSPRK